MAELEFEAFLNRQGKTMKHKRNVLSAEDMELIRSGATIAELSKRFNNFENMDNMPNRELHLRDFDERQRVEEEYLKKHDLMRVKKSRGNEGKKINDLIYIGVSMDDIVAQFPHMFVPRQKGRAALFKAIPIDQFPQPTEGMTTMLPGFAVDKEQVDAWNKYQEEFLHDPRNPTTKEGKVEYVSLGPVFDYATKVTKLALRSAKVALTADMTALITATSGAAFMEFAAYMTGTWAPLNYKLEAAVAVSAITFWAQTMAESAQTVAEFFSNPVKASKNAVLAGPKGAHRLAVLTAMYTWGTYTPHFSALLATPGVTIDAIQDYLTEQVESGELEADTAVAAHFFAKGLANTTSKVLATLSNMSTLMTRYGKKIQENPDFYAPMNEFVDETVAPVVGLAAAKATTSFLEYLGKMLDGMFKFFGVDKMAIGYAKTEGMYLHPK